MSIAWGFDDTRTRDEQQRTAAHRESGKLNRLHAPLTYHGRRRLGLRRARMPMAGFDESGEQRMWLERFRFELGWNCTATYHGCVGSSTISTNLPSSDRPTISSPFSVSAFSRTGS